METVLHNHIGESSYNVKLAIETDAYVVTYGRQREVYPKTPQGLMHATGEYVSCVDHAIDCEGR